jgi:hypothetical protein
MALARWKVDLDRGNRLAGFRVFCCARVTGEDIGSS